MLFYFHAMVILSVVMSSIFVLRFRRGISVHFPMIFLFIPIINLGYMKVATSQNIYEALFANSIEYLDGCFLELFFFLYVMNFCKLKMPKPLTALLLAIGSVILFFSIHTASNGLLYKTAELKQLDGVSYIVKEYGPIHTLYYIMIAFYLVANLSVIIYSLTRKNISKRNSLLLLLVYMVIIVSFLCGKIFHPAFELLPASYLFAQVMFLNIMSRITLYDVTGSAISTLSETGSIGFASFDTKARYLGCTDRVLECIPELDSMFVDQVLTAENENFTKILDCMKKAKESGGSSFFYINKNEISYKVTIEHLYQGKRLKGYQMRTEDNTQETRRLEALKLKERQREMEAEILKLEKSAAEAANEAKSSFLAQMSHELRTPINAMLGFDEMILRESREKDILSYASNIKVSGNNLLSLVNDILDISKIEAGKMEIVPAEYDSASMLGELIREITPRAEAKDLYLKYDIDRRLPARFYGDDVRIKQIITNLLTNAVKYTDDGGITFSVKVLDDTISAGKDIRLAFSVKDTGFGIKEDDKEKLFHAFERADEQRTRSIEGTGLGLAITMKCLELMDSTLELESEYGKGSDFHFILKQKVVDASPAGDIENKNGTAGIADVYREDFTAPSAHILVVDDVAMNLKVFAGLLKNTGIKTDTASGGEEALELIKSNIYDCIFMDHQMPGMDGMETLSKINEEGLNKNGTPVIALTANAISGARDMYMKHGFSDYLTKPINPKALSEMLVKWLPAEKVVRKKADDEILEFLPVDASDSSDNDNDKKLEELRAMGINVDEGLSYAMDDVSFYLEIFSDYKAAFTDKYETLQKAFEKEDLRTYEINIHALKSSSKTVGADDVSAAAKELEKAAADGDMSYIKEHHAEFMELYKKIYAIPL